MVDVRYRRRIFRLVWWAEKSTSFRWGFGTESGAKSAAGSVNTHHQHVVDLQDAFNYSIVAYLPDPIIEQCASEWSSVKQASLVEPEN
jgi:hypothetical protein